MVAEEQPTIDTQKSVPLKLNEPQIDAQNPWGDDLLSRLEISTQLTELVATQEPPLTISLHGQWGTGKTFLLKRWQRALEAAKYEAIYFNAWEDDYCDNPLLAIVGQLSGHFKELGLKRMARKAAKVAAPLIMEGLTGAVKATTGLSLSLELQRQRKKTLLDAYLEQGAAKNHLKTELAKLSKKVADRTGHPLIFIIDELDRCRPTFAVELLERVKHIFDVPNMVFVFGINRDELCKSLKSVYGGIDTDIYLRRFFDIELNLPPSDSMKFSQELIQKFGLNEHFLSMSRGIEDRLHAGEFGTLAGSFPPLWAQLEFSPRDIQYCVSQMALVSRNLQPRYFMYPWILGLLITLRVRNLALYRDFKHGTCRSSKVIDYFHDLLPMEGLDHSLSHAIMMAEASLYGAESGDVLSPAQGITPLVQLRLLREGKELTNPESLSKRTRQRKTNFERMIQVIENVPDFRWNPNTKTHIISLIDLHQAIVRR